MVLSTILWLFAGLYVGFFLAKITGRRVAIISTVLTALVSVYYVYRFTFSPMLGLPQLPEMSMVFIGSLIVGFWVTKVFKIMGLI